MPAAAPAAVPAASPDPQSRPVEPPANVLLPDSASADDTIVATAGVRVSPRPAAAAPRATRSLVVAAAAIAVAAIVLWFGLRAFRTRAVEAPPSGAASPSSAAGGTGAPRGPAPAVVGRPPETAATAAAPASPAPATPAAAAGAATIPGGFDIVVGSFRTDARAAALAASVSALGVPSRRRVSNGWQQVVSGPFATRSDAEAAQQRLQRGGLSGSQIVPTAR
jgi:cell division protein FtsN